MPTPLGHALVGAAIVWSAESFRRAPLDPRPRTSLAVVCAGLAVAPDLDLLYPPIHRMMSHSLLAVGVVGAVAWIVARRTHRDRTWLVTTACVLAYASHLGLDWLGGDTKQPPGIQALWPFSDAWFISSWGVFRATDLGAFFIPSVILSNALAVLRELAILGPVALVAWLLRGQRPFDEPVGRKPQVPANPS
jgi:membrane-bound metal-dependent hydrolase YbcI (DUF457 family)